MTRRVGNSRLFSAINRAGNIHGCSRGNAMQNIVTTPNINDMTEVIVPPNDLVETPLQVLFRDNKLDGEGAVTHQVYRLFHRLIVNLRLVPNQPLSVNEASEALEISKTPVRETFIRLAEDGLVNIIPKKGTFVAPINIQKAFEGYFIRISLESACADAIARNGTESDIQLLRRELDRQRQCLEQMDYDKFYILDNQFHGALYLVAGLPNTKKQVDTAKAEVDRIKGLKSIYRVCRPDEVLFREHEEIIDAIAGRDGELAQRKVEEHLTGMNDAIQAIAKEEQLWGMVNTINQRARKSDKHVFAGI